MKFHPLLQLLRRAIKSRGGFGHGHDQRNSVSNATLSVL